MVYSIHIGEPLNKQKETITALVPVEIYDVAYIEKGRNNDITMCNGLDILIFKSSGEFIYNNKQLEVDKELYGAFKTFLGL